VVPQAHRPDERADGRRRPAPEAAAGRLRALLERDARRRERWIETDRIGYQCNRMVAYPSGCLHSATRHFGGGNDHGRLYQTFRVGWIGQAFAPVESALKRRRGARAAG
jgi:hypothetical protein